MFRISTEVFAACTVGINLFASNLRLSEDVRLYILFQSENKPHILINLNEVPYFNDSHFPCQRDHAQQIFQRSWQSQNKLERQYIYKHLSVT